ncbi:MAG: UDP-N-acetylglucosamine 1-carboxyvinyltransferase, partial [Bacteroidaceae bacterium]|nr:UDP-N-acetylglucosamine 1-carboxyvinyltransferase [Bacteroidaceae bacterium]
MAAFIIDGGYPLQGDITPQGAKNEALQVLCAVLLTDEPVRIKNLPDIADVNNQIGLLQQIGVSVERNAPGDLTFCARGVCAESVMSQEFLEGCSNLRGSVMMLGPLLARFGQAAMARPGGDKIGRRRLDTHFMGMERLGASFAYDGARGVYTIQAKELHGAYMLLDEASVTGTANIIMAAVTAKGTTTIYNAACEPYLQQLCQMLVGMGARISGIASNLLTIEGVSSLHGTTHTILPDMIEIGSFIGMGAMVGHGIRIRGVHL